MENPLLLFFIYFLGSIDCQPPNELDNGWKRLGRSSIFWKLSSNPESFDEAQSSCVNQNDIDMASSGLASFAYAHNDSAWKSLTGKKLVLSYFTMIQHGNLS